VVNYAEAQIFNGEKIRKLAKKGYIHRRADICPSVMQRIIDCGKNADSLKKKYHNYLIKSWASIFFNPELM